MQTVHNIYVVIVIFQPIFLKNLRTAIQPDTVYVMVFFLDSKREFLYSHSHKNQSLIIDIAGMSRANGMKAEGPITDLKQLPVALEHAIRPVEKG